MARKPRSDRTHNQLESMEVWIHRAEWPKPPCERGPRAALVTSTDSYGNSTRGTTTLRDTSIWETSLLRHCFQLKKHHSK